MADPPATAAPRVRLVSQVRARPGAWPRVWASPGRRVQGTPAGQWAPGGLGGLELPEVPELGCRVRRRASARAARASLVSWAMAPADPLERKACPERHRVVRAIRLVPGAPAVQ